MVERDLEVNYGVINPPGTGIDFLRSHPFEQVIVRDITYEGGERKLRGAVVDDRLYGRFEFDAHEPGDAALLAIINSEPFNRLDLIEQLILPPEFATKPETSGFTRYEHSMGVMLLTRKLGGDAKQQIRALVHDLPQTAFSHLGDWRKQGMGGADNYHDSILAEYMRQWDMDVMLAEHGFDLSEITDKSIQDIVERDSPDLCADRIDYALREFARWTCPGDVPYLISQLDVRDDMIVFKSPEAARVFGDYYHDLFWLHWAELEHAFKEKLFLSMIERGHEKGIIQEEDMYSVDPVIMTKLEMANDEVVNELWWILSRKRLVLELIKGVGEAFSEERMAQETDALFVPISSFKTRSVDPSYIRSDGSIAKLSERDSEFKEFLEAHRTYGNDVYGWEFAKRLGYDWKAFIKLAVDPAVKSVLSGRDGLI